MKSPIPHHKSIFMYGRTRTDGQIQFFADGGSSKKIVIGQTLADWPLSLTTSITSKICRRIYQAKIELGWVRGGSQRFKLFGLITAWGCKGGWVEGPHPLGGHNFAPCGAIKTNFVRPGPDLRCGCAESAEYNAWLGAGSERCTRVREELSFNFSWRTGNKN